MVWAVVDVGAAPELFESVIQCKANSVRCVRCGNDVRSSHAIVLYRALRDHPFIITSADLSLPESEGSVAFYFMCDLADRLGYDRPWLNNYINNSLPIIPRIRLAKTFKPKRPTPEHIEQAATLVSTKTWIGIADLLTDCPDLVSVETEDLLDRMAGSLLQEDRADEAELFERRRDLIRTVRSVGLAQAILDVTGMSLEQLREETIEIFGADPAVIDRGEVSSAGSLRFDSPVAEEESKPDDQNNPNDHE